MILNDPIMCFTIFCSALYCTALYCIVLSYPILSYPTLPLTINSTQMSLEDSFANYAISTGQDSVILCDRGVMDGQAYVAEDTWRTVLQVSTCVLQIIAFLFLPILNYHLGKCRLEQEGITYKCLRFRSSSFSLPTLLSFFSSFCFFSPSHNISCFFYCSLHSLLTS